MKASTALAPPSSKFVDALVWGFFPVYLHAKGFSLIDIGWIVGVYGFVWGGSQLWTGPLSDAMGRKWPIVIGMWTCAAGIAATLFADGLVEWSIAAGITGVGMALLYPTLIAAIWSRRGIDSIVPASSNPSSA